MWLIVFVIVTCLFYYSWQKLRYFSAKGVRTLPPIPFFGNLTAVTLGRENFVEAIAAGYSTFENERYFGLYQYHVPTLVPRDPELIRQIMVRDFNCFSDRGVHIPADCDPLFGRNLIMLRGTKWREMRAALSPAFSAARSRSMAPLMNACADASVDYLKTHIEDGREIDTDEIVQAYVNDVIASCAFGFAVDSLRDPGNCVLRLGRAAVVQRTTQVMKFFGYENFPAVMKAPKLLDRFEKFFHNQNPTLSLMNIGYFLSWMYTPGRSGGQQLLLGVKIISSSDAEQFAHLFKSALKARRAQDSQPRPDFIQTLVDAAQGKLKQGKYNDDINNNKQSTNWTQKFSDNDLVAQAVLFYVAGFDTTGNLINYFLYEMAANGSVQQRLLDEIDAISSTEDLYQTVQGMEYLDMCVSEVLRLWPLVGSADRRSVAPYNFGPTHPGSKRELIAEAGIHVWLPIYSLHRDPRYWPEPHALRPERFARGSGGEGGRDSIVPYTYLPFGDGPRHCIGSRFAVLAAKVFLVRFFSEYRVRKGQKTPPAQRLHPVAFILRPAAGFHLYVEPRNLIQTA